MAQCETENSRELREEQRTNILLKMKWHRQTFHNLTADAQIQPTDNSMSWMFFLLLRLWMLGTCIVCVCVQSLFEHCFNRNYNDFRELRTGSAGGLETRSMHVQTSFVWIGRVIRVRVLHRDDGKVIYIHIYLRLPHIHQTGSKTISTSVPK